MSAGGRDRPLASLARGDLRHPVEIFGQVGRQRGHEYRPADGLRILGAAEPIEDVDLQPGDIPAFERWHVRALCPVEGFLEPPRGDKAFGNLFGRRGFAAGQSLRRDVAVDVGARIGDIFQGDRRIPLTETLLPRAGRGIDPCSGRVRWQATGPASFGGKNPSTGQPRSLSGYRLAASR
ncbi:MAG TPA: hypothetical protein VJX94_24355 [Stellaceae bacterium]|nr:hypothetical protein [Stellaceae bacterium]